MKKYYVGMDVHNATIAIAVLDAFGKISDMLSDLFRATRSAHWNTSQ